VEARLDNIPAGQDYDLCVYYSGSSSVLPKHRSWRCPTCSYRGLCASED